MCFLGARCLATALQAKERRKPHEGHAQAHTARKWHSKNSHLGLLAAPRLISRRKETDAKQHSACHARALRPDYHSAGCQHMLAVNVKCAPPGSPKAQSQAGNWYFVLPLPGDKAQPPSNPKSG